MGHHGMVATLLGIDAAAQSKPEGQLVIAFGTTIASSYLDPAETTGLAALCGFSMPFMTRWSNPSLAVP